MTRHLSKLSLGIAAVLVSASLAVAQTTPATPVAPTTAVKAPPTAVVPPKADPAKAPAAKVATTPWGIHCSAEADKQTLKGKEREKFRSKCIREYKKANPTATATSKPVVPAGAVAPPGTTTTTTTPPAAKKAN